MVEVEVDPAFIQAIEHRPNLKPTIDLSSEIPLIDLSISDYHTINHLVSEIKSACEHSGFFHVINHGVPLDLHPRIESLGRLFFAQKLEEKKKVKKDERHPMGFHDGEVTKDVRDWKEVFDFLVQDPTLIPSPHDPDGKEMKILTNQWPQYPHQFREVCEEYAKELGKLAHKILELICLSLGLPSDRLTGYFKDQTSLVRFNYYPPCPSPDLALGLGRHKDGSAFTIVSEDDVGGLQVKRNSDGEWIPIKPIPNAYIINLGETVQVWTNDRYESREHRVVANSEKDRISIPFFFFPANYVMVKPLEELTSEESPPKHEGYTWGKFFANRKRSDVKK